LTGKDEKPAVLIVAWYLRIPWSDAQIIQHAQMLLKGPIDAPVKRTLKELLEQCVA
jgi:hypothetical protein